MPNEISKGISNAKTNKANRHFTIQQTSKEFDDKFGSPRGEDRAAIHPALHLQDCKTYTDRFHYYILHWMPLVVLLQHVAPRQQTRL